MASHEIEALSQALARLPGLGPRSARRAVLHLMKRRESALVPLLAALQDVAKRLSTWSTCGNLDTSDPCAICSDQRRDDRLLCVVEEVADLWALDRSRPLPRRFPLLCGPLARLGGGGSPRAGRAGPGGRPPAPACSRAASTCSAAACRRSRACGPRTSAS